LIHKHIDKQGFSINGLPLFQWSDSYQTGNDLVDHEHRHLFALLKDILNIQNNQGADNPRVLAALESFLKSVKAHFQSEEELMLRHNFSGYERHRQKHRHLITQAENILCKADNEQSMLSLGMISFLHDWLTKHILEEDIELALLGS